ncbi:MAG: DsbC family protein [Gammaproteobacteria bacterium]|nr:DsbC family protein [Gammaproteobacteria bacterium]
MHLRHALAVSLLCCLSTAVPAQEAVPAAVSQALAKLIPDMAPTSVKPAPAAGLYEVVYGPEVVYVTADGAYLLKGDVIDLKTQDNLTEDRRTAARLKALEDLGEANMIVFGPKDAKHTVTVFTDVDCPYCVKVHQEVPELNRQGVKVRYLAYPRAGVGSPGYRKTVSVWCAPDRNQALSDAKSGKAVPEKTCDSPVDEHYMMGQMLGISGTPTLVLDDGRMIPGYVPAARLVQALNASKAPPSAAKPGG